MSGFRQTMNITTCTSNSTSLLRLFCCIIHFYPIASLYTAILLADVLTASDMRMSEELRHKGNPKNLLFLHKMRHDITKLLKWWCARRKVSLSLLCAQWVAKDPSFIVRTVKTDQTGQTQADLSLCWAHSHIVGFVMLPLKFVAKWSENSVRFQNMGIGFQMGQILWDFISQCEIWHVWNSMAIFYGQYLRPGNSILGGNSFSLNV